MTSRNRKKRSYWWVWIFIGTAIGLVLANHHALDPVKEPLWTFLNSNFSTAFWGAIAGSLTIIFIDWLRRQRQILADVNTSIGILASLSNALINMKQQHVMPLVINYQNNLNNFQTIQAIRQYGGAPPEPVVVNINMHMKKFHCPELHFDLPMDRLFTMTDRMPSIVPLIAQTKRTIGEVGNMCDIWNEAVESFKDLSEEEKIPTYFGLRAGPDIVDTSYRDTISNVAKVVDDGLFFANLSIKAVTEIGKRTLPFWLKDKIAKSEITRKEHRDLLPPADYLDGWSEEEILGTV